MEGGTARLPAQYRVFSRPRLYAFSTLRDIRGGTHSMLAGTT
jgi:hypothetical protein